MSIKHRIAKLEKHASADHVDVAAILMAGRTRTTPCATLAELEARYREHPDPLLARIIQGRKQLGDRRDLV